jgi:hypothetical protein
MSRLIEYSRYLSLVAFAYFVVKSPPAADSPPASRGSSDEHRS